MQKSETNTKIETIKRLFACMMVIVMAMTAVPFGVLDGVDLGVKASAASVVKSGNCGAEGDNVKWKLYSDGKLEITGKGKMANFNYEESFTSPYCEKIKSVVIANGITHIGECAFMFCTELKQATIPDSVTSIGMMAFRGTDLTSVTIPEGVTSIYYQTFCGCVNLTNVSIPGSVKIIENEAFLHCAIKQLTIPEGVEELDCESFYNCNNLTSVIIPSSMKKIVYGAFEECYNIKDIYYAGTKEKWKKVCEEPILEFVWSNPTIHYNYKPCNHTFKTTTTPATASKDGKIVTACTICKTVTKTVVIAKASSVSIPYTSYTYNGKVKTPTVSVKDSKGKTLKNGTDYTITYASGRKNIGKYAVKVTFKGNYSGTKTLYFNIVPPATGKLSVSQSSSTVKASWKAVSGVTGYKVYLYKGSKLLKSVKTKKTSYTFKSLASGTTYKVVVKAYKTVGKSDYASSSKSLTVATKPGTPTLKVTAGSKKAALAWKKQTGASGYLVYMSTSKNGTYKKVKTVKGGSSVKYTKTGLTKGKTYYFKVRAYKTVDGKNIYGSFSSVKAVKVK